MDEHEVKRRLNILINQLNIPIKSIARKTNVNYSTFIKWLRDQRSLPTQYLQSLIKYLNETPYIKEIFEKEE